MDVFELYKPFRNKISQLELLDALQVVWAYCQYLQFRDRSMPEGIEVSKEFLRLDLPQRWISEWGLEVIAREILINAGAATSARRTLRSWRVMSETVNQLRYLENEIYKLCGADHDVLIEVIRIAHRQFVWQNNPPNASSAVRYFKIFDHPDINIVCAERTGLTVRDAFRCGMAILSLFLARPTIKLPFTSEIAELSADKIGRLLSFTCKRHAELKLALQSEQQYNSKFAYAYNSLRAFPLVSVPIRGHDVIVCPLPTILFWRITGGLYYLLVDNPRFQRAFGENFQRYVGHIVQRACNGGQIRVLAEQEYGPKSARKDTVDWIIDDGDAALFLECKAKRLSWNAKTALDDLGPLDADIDHMANAVVQVYKTTTDYLANRYPNFALVPDRKIFPTVVTLENWRMFGPRMLSRLQAAIAGKLSASGVSGDLLRDMPYSIWPVEELEIGMQVIDRVGVRRFLDGKINDPEMTQWEWVPYIQKHFPDHLPGRKLFTQEEYHDLFPQTDPQPR